VPALGSVEALAARMAAQARRGVLPQRPTPVRDLVDYLSGEFASGHPLRLTSSRPDTTGQTLSDRMVSRLELLNAVRYLPYRQRRLVELRFCEQLPVHEVCQRLGIAERTYYRDQLEALEAICSVVYEW
jgi:DNA-directed RNA polymerase specialized sigma24 family protein